MARNKQTVTLSLGLEVKNDDLQKVSKTLDDLGKTKLSTGKSNNYLQTMIGDVNGYIKSIKALQKELQKPMRSKTQAKDIGYAMSAANTAIGKQLGANKSAITKIFNSPKNSQNIIDIKNLGKQINGIQQLIDKVRELRKASSDIGALKSLDTKRIQTKTELKQLGKKDNLTIDEINKQKDLVKVLDEVNAKLEKKEELQKQINSLLQSGGYSSLGEAEAARNDLILQQNNLQDETIGLKDISILEKIYDLLKESVNLIKQGTYSAEELGDVYDTNLEKTRQLNDQQKTFNEVLSELGIPLLTLGEMARLLRQVIDYSYEYVKNLDKALTEISVVSGKTRDEVLALTDTFIELSSKTGMAVDDIAQASTIFYQQGLDDEAVKRMSEYTAIFAKISGEDVPTAADQLTSAINGFGYTADQVASVVDKLSVLAAYSAADVDELAMAMSKAASAASQAGLSFDQYNAYLATMIETTREAPENIGTSLKTIMARFQQIKTGDNTEDDTEVNDVEKALKTVGISLRDAQGELRDLGDVLDELGPKWKGLDRNTQAYLGTVIAGTRQQSRFISLMQHWDRALELTAASENSAGAAAKMHKSAMDGLEASLNELTNTWQKLISNLVNGDTFKWIIKLATSILKIFASGNSALRIITGIIALLNAKTLITNANIEKQNKLLDEQHKVPLKNIDTAWGQIKKKIEETTGAIKQSIKATEDLDDATKKLNNNTNSPIDDNSGDNKNNNGKNNKNNNNLFTKINTWFSGTKIGKKFGNVSKLLGKTQTIITTVTSIATIIDIVGDLWHQATTIGQEDLDQINNKIERTQEKIDKQDKIIEVTTKTVKVYDTLNKKIKLTTKEIEEMGDAAKEIAEVVPEAIMGYDANGNPIINTAVLNAANLTANEKRRELAKTQIDNLIYKEIVQDQVNAANEYKTSQKSQTLSTITSASSTIATASTMLAAGATETALATGAVSPVAIIAWIVAGVSAVTAAVTGFANAAGEAEAKTLAAKKAINEAFSGENLEAIAKEMAVISSVAVGTGSRVGSNGIYVTDTERTKAIGTFATQWINDKKASLYKADLNDAELKKAIDGIGYEWETIITNTLGGEKGLVNITAAINEMAKDVNTKTYENLEEAFNDFVNTEYPNLDKNSELFESLKKAFLKSALAGTSGGLIAAVEQLEIKIENTSGEEQEEYKRILNQVKQMSTREADLYGASGILDNSEVFNRLYNKSGSDLKQNIETNSVAPNLDFIAGLDEVKKEFEIEARAILDKFGVATREELNNSTDESAKYAAVRYDELINNIEDTTRTIENIWNNMAYSAEDTWEQLFDFIDKTYKRVSASQKVLGEINKDGRVAVDTFREWTKTTLDTIDFTNMSAESVEQYGQAIDTITDNIRVENGELVVNKAAMEAIIKVDEISARQAVEAEKAKLNTYKMELEAKKAILVAEKTTLESKLNMGKTEVDANGEWAKAKDKLNTLYIEHAADFASTYVDIFASAYETDLANYNRMLTAKQNGETTYSKQAYYDSWQSAISHINIDEYNKVLNGLTTAQLQEQWEIVNKEIEATDTAIGNIELKMKTLDLSSYITEGALANANEELEIYIGELEEIFNILRKIEGIQSRISLLQIYEDIGTGSIPARAIEEQIKLYDELGDQLDEYLKAQKYIEQEEKRQIKASAVGNVFNFDDYNNIEILWDKYKALGSEEMELADDLYDEYQKIHEETLDYNEQRINALKDEIDVTQKLLDTYNELENNMAQAVKDIYQKMLDEKLEAIDTEIEALDKLKDAYDEANKAADQSKQISNLQTSLKRSIMDTSGASNTKVLDYRDQLRSQLEEMGQDAYTKKMDDIKKSLEDQKEMLKEQFDEFFEDWEKLHNLVEEYVMNDEENVKELFKTTEEYKKANDTQREQLLKDLNTKYIEAKLAIDTGLNDMVSGIDKLKSSIDNLDKNLKDPSFVQSIGTQMSAVLADYLKKNLSGNGSGSTPTGNDLTSKTKDYGTEVLQDPGETKKETCIVIFNYGVGYDTRTVTKGTSVTLPSKYQGVSIKHWEATGRYVSYNAGQSVRVDENIEFIAQFSEADLKTLKKYGTALPPAPDPYDLSHGRVFASGGLSTYTGPAWLDGTKQNPEAVLNAAQTKAFMSLTNNLAKADAMGTGLVGQNINIDSISFEVESMSSPEDGEKAFNAFVNKFKEIGSQSGLSFTKAKI